MKKLTALLLLVSTQGFAAGKFDLAAGLFSLEAETSKAKGSISNLGAYQFAYRREFASQMEFGLGYSVIMADTYTGDMGYGPDLAIYYFPFTSTGGFRYENADTLVVSTELWRPYVGAAFHQRQYQSTQSSYAGFSIIGGTEYSWSKTMGLKAEIRMMSLTGPSQAKATETDILLGVTVPF